MHRGEVTQLKAEVTRLANIVAAINSPLTANFIEGVKREAAYQRKLYDQSDREKLPADWFWTLCFLATKAHEAARRGDKDKALHHTISSAALLLNWHASLTA